MSSHFSHETFLFLRELADHNDRAWFEANKGRYEAHIKEPALRFIEDFAPALASISPHFQAIPKAQGGSLFRIYRDTRFSADKRPYKTNTGMHFRHEAGEDAHAPGFYLHLEPGESGMGAGVWMPDPAALNRVRDAIVAQPERWSAIKADLSRAGFDVSSHGDALKRVPRGYPADHPHAEDLKQKSVAVFRKLSDEEVLAPDFLERFSKACAATSGLQRFLCEAIGVSF